MAPPNACPTGLGIGSPYEVSATPVKPGGRNTCDPAQKQAKVVTSPKVLKMNLKQRVDARIYA